MLMDESARDVYRIRPATIVDGRDTVRTWNTAQGATRTLATVIVQPTTGREDQIGGRDATMAQFQVIDETSPAGFWDDQDRLEMDGTVYQIEGHVQNWPNPLPHAFFLINVWEG